MHSLNHSVMASVTAAERHGRTAAGRPSSRRAERPPGPSLRARAAYSAGRLARRLYSEMARRAVV